MQVELMNIFHLYFRNGKNIIVRCNCTKKQLLEELKAFAIAEGFTDEVNEVFRQVKFKVYMRNKGYKFYYEI